MIIEELPMQRRTFNRLLGAGAVVGTVGELPSGAQNLLRPLSNSRLTSPVDVQTRAQLFVDQLLVHESRRVAFTLHPAEKHADNPLVKADQPWEGWRVELFGTVLYDEQEKLFKMWYTAEGAGQFEVPYPTLYASSGDGVHWSKPLVGTERSRGGKHNVVTLAQQVNVMKDMTDANAERRYKMVGNVDTARPVKGYFAFTSADGFHWKPHGTKPIAPIRLKSAPAHVGNGDNLTAYYDEQRRLYVAFPKIKAPIRGHYRRSYFKVISHDFEKWSEPELVLAADARDDAGALRRIEEVRPLLDAPDDPALMRTEFYTVGFYPAESCTLCFISLLTVNNNARTFPRNQEGPGEVQLAVSRDLSQWERPFRTPCIARGALNDWDSGFFMTASRAIRVADEIWLYYTGMNFTHGSPVLYSAEGTGRGTRYTASIGLAKWKLDRFVSVDGPAEGGTLTTVPIVFSGSRLEINARVKDEGAVSVELLDAAGRSLPGFGLSVPLHGDDLRHQVYWRGNPPVAELRGRPITLRFHLRNAELYSFAFR